MRTPATTPTAPGRVWFVTGASRGLGRAFAAAALGDAIPAPGAHGDAS